MIAFENFINRDFFLVFSVLFLLALAALICERSGIINIALEGKLIGGVLGYTLTTFLLKTYSNITHPLAFYFISLLAAFLIVSLISLLFSFFVVYFKINQILTAIAINIFMYGLASFLITTFKDQTELVQNTDYLNLYLEDVINYPSLSYFYIYLGSVFPPIMINFIITILIASLVYVFLFETKLGLRLRSCGESPKVSTSGICNINVNRYRFSAIFVAGILIAFASSIYSEWKPSFSGSVNGFGYLGLMMLILGMRNIFFMGIFTFIFVMIRTFVLTIISWNGSKYKQFTELLEAFNYLLPLLGLIFYGIFFKEKYGKNAIPEALGK